MKLRTLRLKCDGTRAETTFRLTAKWTRPFKSAGASVQSTNGSRVVRISGSNAGYTMFRGSEEYWLPFTSPTVRHRVPSHFNWTLPKIYLRLWCLANSFRRADYFGDSDVFQNCSLGI